MIKEYDEVKQYLDRKVSSKFLPAAVFVNEIYTNEYNALDINIIGTITITDDFYSDLKRTVKRKYGNIVTNFEMVDSVFTSHTSILVYLRPTIEIRSDKIHKIKSNILT